MISGPITPPATRAGNGSGLIFVPVAFTAQTRHSLLQLALRRVERIAKHDVYVLVPVALRSLHVDDHVLSGERHLHLHVEDLSLVMMPMRGVDDDTARLNAVAEDIEVRREVADACLDRRRRLHMAKRDLDGDGHDTGPCSGCTAQGYTAGRPAKVQYDGCAYRNSSRGTSPHNPPTAVPETPTTR